MSKADKVRPVLGGGMISSGSVAVMSRTISLCAGSPGMIDRVPLRSLMASSRRSRRSFALRVLSSGPWQLKHLLAMSGRICELKSTGSVGGFPVELAANAAPIQQAANSVEAVRWVTALIRRFILTSILYQLDRLKQRVMRTDCFRCFR